MKCLHARSLNDKVEKVYIRVVKTFINNCCIRKHDYITFMCISFYRKFSVSKNKLIEYWNFLLRQTFSCTWLVRLARSLALPFVQFPGPAPMRKCGEVRFFPAKNRWVRKRSSGDKIRINLRVFKKWIKKNCFFKLASPSEKKMIRFYFSLKSHRWNYTINCCYHYYLYIYIYMPLLFMTSHKTTLFMT